MGSLNIANLLELPDLPVQLERVDKAIVKVLATDNKVVAGPLSRLSAKHGKRLRPSLLIAVTSSQGKKIDDSIISACVAIELAHIGSLVHDDIIDKASTRWDIPTVNSSDGDNIATMVGDVLFATACLEAAKVSTSIAKRIPSAIIELCDGECRELADEFNVGRNKDDYLRSIRGKTAALFSAACEIGALCSGLSAYESKSFASYGRDFGMAFQLIDDLADLLSSPELLGKPAGNDIREGVYTLPILLSLKGANAENLKNMIKKSAPIQTNKIVDILLNDGSIKRTLSMIRKYDKSAAAALGDKASTGLLNFPDQYLNWSLQNLIAKQYKSVVLAL